MDPSFTDAERRFVLAEMIKASEIDVGLLVDFVKRNNVQPDWLSMQLPGGRNMHQCIRAAENMFNVPMHPPPIAPLKRKSLGDLNESVPKRLAVMNPNEHHPMSSTTHVNIQPRPSPNTPNGFVFASTSSPTLSTTGTGRKRGRPSKAEKEAQARANASHSTGYPPTTLAPIAPQPPISTTSEPGSLYEARPINFQPYGGYQKKKTRDKKPKSSPRAADSPLDLRNLLEPDDESQRQTPSLRESERIPSPAASHMAAAAISATDG